MRKTYSRPAGLVHGPDARALIEQGRGASLGGHSTIAYTRTEVIDREGATVRRRFEAAALTLSLFYRDRQDDPVIAGREHLPLSFPARANETEKIDRDLVTAATHRPELRQFRLTREKLEVDRRLVRLAPDDEVAHYNLACNLALAGQTRDGLQQLRRALELGYRDFRYLTMDGDLDALRDTTEYQELAREYGFEP